MISRVDPCCAIKMHGVRIRLDKELACWLLVILHPTKYLTSGEVLPPEFDGELREVREMLANDIALCMRTGETVLRREEGADEEVTWQMPDNLPAMLERIERLLKHVSQHSADPLIEAVRKRQLDSN